MINRDMVIEFHDTGCTESFLPVCNTVIIMARGLINKFKQLLGYFLLHSVMNADELLLLTNYKLLLLTIYKLLLLNCVQNIKFKT